MIKFKAKVVVGIEGVALLDLNAKGTGNHKLITDPAKIILEDIREEGIGDWIHDLYNTWSEYAGTYLIKGGAIISEDMIDYVDVQFRPYKSKDPVIGVEK